MSKLPPYIVMFRTLHVRPASGPRQSFFNLPPGTGAVPLRCDVWYLKAWIGHDHR